MRRTLTAQRSATGPRIIAVTPDAVTIAPRLSARVGHQVPPRGQTFTQMANELSYLMGFSKPVLEMAREEGDY